MGTFGGQKLTVPQIYAYAVQGGFPPGLWATLATATAMTESAGWTAAVSSTGASGLWQITHGNYTSMGRNQAQAFDPLQNAQMAHQLWQNRGGANAAPARAFADWWPYDGGPSNRFWNQYLAAAQTAAAGPAPLQPGAPDISPGAGLGGPVNQPTGTGPGASLGGKVGISPAGVITGGPGDIDTIIGGNLPDWLRNTWTALGSIPQNFTYLYQWLSGPVGDLENLVKGLLWLVNPANWVRITAGVIGAALVVAGAVLVATSA